MTHIESATHNDDERVVMSEAANLRLITHLRLTTNGSIGLPVRRRCTGTPVPSAALMVRSLGGTALTHRCRLAKDRRATGSSGTLWTTVNKMAHAYHQRR